jgi:hypothetical protein
VIFSEYETPTCEGQQCRKDSQCRLVFLLEKFTDRNNTDYSKVEFITGAVLLSVHLQGNDLQDEPPLSEAEHELLDRLRQDLLSSMQTRYQTRYQTRSNNPTLPMSFEAKDYEDLKDPKSFPTDVQFVQPVQSTSKSIAEPVEPAEQPATDKLVFKEPDPNQKSILHTIITDPAEKVSLCC